MKNENQSVQDGSFERKQVVHILDPDGERDYWPLSGQPGHKTFRTLCKTFALSGQVASERVYFRRANEASEWCPRCVLALEQV